MIDDTTKENANRIGNTGDVIGNAIVTLIGAVDALEERINNIKECICEDICVEPKKVSAPFNQTTNPVKKTTKKRSK